MPNVEVSGRRRKRTFTVLVAIYCHQNITICTWKLIFCPQELEKVQEGDLSFMDGDIIEDEDDADAEKVLKRRKLMEAYDRNTKRYVDPSEYPSDEEGIEEPSLIEMDEEEDQR